MFEYALWTTNIICMKFMNYKYNLYEIYELQI